MIKDELIEKIQSHKATIGVVGLGYVGLPLVLRFGEEHFPDHSRQRQIAFA